MHPYMRPRGRSLVAYNEIYFLQVSEEDSAVPHRRPKAVVSTLAYLFSHDQYILSLVLNAFGVTVMRRGS